MKNWRVTTRMALGSWLVLAAFNQLFIHLLPLPRGTHPLAVQLLGALERSGLVTLAFFIMLVAGALLLTRLFVSLALVAVMPVNVGAAYWAVVLENDLLWGAVALLTVAATAALMLVRLPAYRPMLELRPPAVGEHRHMRYEAIYVAAFGGISWRRFALALLPLLAAAAFFRHFLPPIYAQWNLMVLAIPLGVLLIKLAQPARHHRR